jgi:hypothetical protein
MIQINLTPHETILLYSFLEKVYEKLHMVHYELDNPELTSSLMESIMTKIATELETKSNNN